MGSQDAEEDSEQHPQEKSGQIISPRVRRRIGEAAVLALFFIADAIGVWPESHGTALLIGAVGTCAVLFIELPLGPWLISSFVVGLATTGFYWSIGPISRPDVEVIGTLQPGSQPDPPNDCPKEQELGTAWRITFGTSTIQFNDPAEVPLIAVGDCRLVFIKPENGGLSVTANLFDAAGNLIASIKNNEFHALSGSRASVERDHDLSKLIVKDGAGAEILFVQYVNKRTVHVRGIFACPGHTPVHIRDGEPLPGIHVNACINVAKGVRPTRAVLGAQ